MTFHSLLVLAVVALTVAGCTGPSGASGDDNPFFTESPLLFNMPDFDRIEDHHFAPAYERGMAEQRAEIDAIANESEPPTLENTLVALESAGRLLQRVSATFSNLRSANTNETLEAVRSEMAPKLAAHRDQIFLNGRLFERIKAVYDQRNDLDLDPESLRLVER